MKQVSFVCRRCGCRFSTDVLEEGEAQARRIRPVPVRCPECRSDDVEGR